MSYGQNLPFGMQAVRSLTSASYNSQGNPYYINKESVSSIFRGDLVAIDNNGLITSLKDVAGFQTAASIGVFNGCSYIVPTGNNPISPAYTGASYWPKNTVVVPNSIPVAFVLDDPNIVYTIQTNSAVGATQALVGRTRSVGFNADGNTTTGVSTMFLDQDTGALQTSNLKILSVLPSPDGSTTTSYNVLEVIIQNHRYLSRPL